MKLKDFLWLTKDVNPEAEIVIQIWGGVRMKSETSTALK